MCPLPGETVHPAPVQALRQLAFYIDDKEKKMSKKLLFNLLAVLMLASIVLSACGSAAPAQPAATEAPAKKT
jgi:hypothetical protein